MNTMEINKVIKSFNNLTQTQRQDGQFYYDKIIQTKQQLTSRNDIQLTLYSRFVNRFSGNFQSKRIKQQKPNQNRQRSQSFNIQKQDKKKAQSRYTNCLNDFNLIQRNNELQQILSKKVSFPQFRVNTLIYQQFINTNKKETQPQQQCNKPVYENSKVPFQVKVQPMQYTTLKKKEHILKPIQRPVQIQADNQKFNHDIALNNFSQMSCNSRDQDFSNYVKNLI